MGIAQAGNIITDGANVAIQGVKPAGIAVQGQVIWKAAAQPASWQLLAQVSTQAATTPTAIDTTGANLLVVVASSYYTTGTGISDSAGNTWTLGPNITGPQTGVSRIWYCINPVTSTTHTFGFNASYGSFAVLAFTSNSAEIVVDQQSTAQVASGTTLLMSAITPTANNSLIITGATNVGSITAIDSGFDIVANYPWVLSRSLAAAYLVQNVAASISPTWTMTENANYPGGAATILSFKPVTAPPWQLLNSSSIQGSVNLSLNTTGANLLVAICTTSAATNGGVITDDQGNTWSVGARYGTGPGSSIHYCINPITSTTHMITLSQNAYPGLIILAYRGPTSILFDQSSVGASTGTNTSLTLGSLTPSAANSLIVTGMTNNTDIGVIDSGFTVLVNNPNPGTINANAVASLVQGSMATIAPTWTKSTSFYASAATMLSFKPS